MSRLRESIHTFPGEQFADTTSYIMPPDQLKLVATRHFNNASQIETALQARAPVAASRAKEILETITKARKDYKNKSASFTAVTPTSSAPSTSTSSEVITTVTNVDDVWADFTSTAPSTESIAKPAPKPKSSLFGSTFSKKPSAPAPTASRPKGKSSGLFGSTISSKKTKETSPTYEDIASRVLGDLIPAKRPIIESAEASAEATTQQPLAISASSQSTIPPSLSGQPQSSSSGAAFDQTAPVAEPESDLPEPSPPKRPKTEEVVQVKKSSKPQHRSKPKQDRRRSSSPSWGMKGHKDKESKTKERTAEVPTFDYSTAPNLLDNPRSGVKDQGRKKKKERKQPKGEFYSCREKELMVDFSGADFGPAPKEKSNMRAGNKSGQF
jgi:hypothetical protein